MNKKILSLIAVGVLSISLVACSSGESEKVDGGNATAVEEKNDGNEETKKEEIVLVDDELAKIVVTEKKADPFGAGYVVSVENKSDKKIIVQTRDTSVDGTMEEPIFSIEVRPGKKANDMMQFTNITELEGLKNVEGKLVILDENFMDIKSYDMTLE